MTPKPGAPAADRARTIETPETLFLTALHAINEKYETGALEYIRDHRPELYGRIARAFERIDETGAGGAGPSAAFKDALRTWYNLNLDAIRIFKGRGK